MTIVKTSVFQLEAPADDEPFANWAAIARRNSSTMEAAMVQRVTPPGIPDLNAETAARQAADTALDGRVTLLEGAGGARARATLYATAAQTGLTGWQTITLAGETIDSHGGHAAGAAGYTVPAGQAGDWFITAQVPLLPATSGNGAVRLMRNGALLAPNGHGEYLPLTASGGVVSLAGRLVTLAVGDVLTIQALAAGTWATQADTSAGVALTSQMTLHRIG